MGFFAFPPCLACSTRLYVCTPHMHSSYVCCTFFYIGYIILGWLSRAGFPSTRIFMQLNSHTALLTWSDSTTSSLFLSIGTKPVFLQILKWWRGSVCVGSCTHVCHWVLTCGKSWEFAEIFTPSFPHCFLAAHKLCCSFKNLEVRLLNSRNRGPCQPEKLSSKRQKKTLSASVFGSCCGCYCMFWD